MINYLYDMVYPRLSKEYLGASLIITSAPFGIVQQMQSIGRGNRVKRIFSELDPYGEENW